MTVLHSFKLLLKFTSSLAMEWKWIKPEVSLCNFFLIINHLTAQYFDKIEQKYQKQISPFLPLMNQFMCSILHSDHV